MMDPALEVQRSFYQQDGMFYPRSGTTPESHSVEAADSLSKRFIEKFRAREISTVSHVCTIYQAYHEIKQFYWRVVKEPLLERGASVRDEKHPVFIKEIHERISSDNFALLVYEFRKQGENLFLIPDSSPFEPTTNENDDYIPRDLILLDDIKSDQESLLLPDPDSSSFDPPEPFQEKPPEEDPDQLFIPPTERLRPYMFPQGDRKVFRIPEEIPYPMRTVFCFSQADASDFTVLFQTNTNNVLDLLVDHALEAHQDSSVFRPHSLLYDSCILPSLYTELKNTSPHLKDPVEFIETLRRYPPPQITSVVEKNSNSRRITVDYWYPGITDLRKCSEVFRLSLDRYGFVTFGQMRNELAHRRLRHFKTRFESVY